MQNKHKKVTKNLFICLVFLIISLLLGVICDDYLLIGSITLFFGCSQILFMTQGIWWQEIFGILENLFTIAICLFSKLYGSVIFTVLIFLPISIFTLSTWKSNQTNGSVMINQMTSKASITTIFILIASTILISVGLSKLPNQNLPVLDTLCNMFDLAAVVLLALRYKEGWIMWILCAITNLIMWTKLYITGQSQNSLMMIILSVIYLGMYCWGYISFVKIRKKQEKLSLAY